LDSSGDDLTPRPSLPGDREADVAIVGGGFTGLWTAWYLRRADPSLRIVLLEAEICGFGASGRNGGWCSALFPASLDQLASFAGRDAAVAQYRAMIDTVDEVGRAVDELGLDVHWAKGGTLAVATNPAHVPRLRAQVAHDRSWGFGDADQRWLNGHEVRERFRVATADGAPVLGGAFTPHCAAVHPGRLVRGLARAVESAGVVLYEGTRVRSIDAGRVRTEHGDVRAPVVLRCTEGYTPGLSGHERDVIPVYSLMIATAPLPARAWDEIGLAARETFTDGRHLLIYGQRTADGRVAFGGRGAPYHFGSAVRDGYDRDEAVFAALRHALHELLPATREVPITHEWGGPLAVPRDWTASVHLDRRSGLGSAGGYVGDGVSTTNLAGRTLADLVLGVDSDLVRLPWVGHESPRWEPEPLRWLGVNTGRSVAELADRSERRRRRPARLAGRVMELFTGGH
jgi:glycine/D-amino acid oxidase-like deaminating enzyme